MIKSKKMKKLILTASVLMGGLLNAQTYPFTENFDAMTSGQAPTGTWVADGFKVMAGHGSTVPNACSVEMNSANLQDTLITPLIGPLTATSIMSIDYRLVNKTLYPSTGTTLSASDIITIDAYVNGIGIWQNAVATINSTSNPTPNNAYATFSYGPSSILTGQTIKLRIDVAAGAGEDWYLDIDNVIIQNQTGVAYNGFNPPALLAFPNPTSGNFSVWIKNYQGTNAVELKLYNHMGQLVKTINTNNVLNNQFDVNTTDLAKGMYIVEVKSGNEISKTKVVVE